jgi:peptidyl-prolyl cis-trans isomerase B (cyclophilin B)
MKERIRNSILIILIVFVIGLIAFLLFNAIKSINYNKNAKNPIVTLDIEGYGKVKIELYPDYAPNTVKTFVKLVQNGYYNGKVFYGLDEKTVNAGMALVEKENEEEDEEGNLVKTGETTITAEEDYLRVSDLDKSVTPYVGEDSEDSGTDDYKISIEGEFVANGFNDNTLRFEYGTVGLYRNNYSQYVDGLKAESYNSGSSLFFIETEEDSSLNGQYAAFGKVIEGMEIIEQLKQLPLEETEESSASSIQKFAQGSYPVIKTATVDTYGVEYGMPDYIEAFDYNSYITNMFLQQYYNNQK